MRRTYCATGVLMVVAVATATADEADLRPGLVARYRSLATDAAVVRVDPKPAFTWGTGSPHPRLPAGPFEVTWSGYVVLREPGPIRVGANVEGLVRVTIDGVEVLPAGKPLTREPGSYRMQVRYRSRAGVPARVQLWWEGKTFAREPLPAARLKHHPADEPAVLKQEQLAERGREAVGRLGCARCHASAFPALTDAPPGPALGDLGTRVKLAWLVEWLGDPAKLRDGARMPALFSADARGLEERTLVAEYLLAETGKGKPPDVKPGDHRAGKQAYLGLGCIACHGDPDKPAKADPEVYPLAKLPDRLPLAHLANFLREPASRYPDGRMPKLPVPADTARNIATYLLMDAKATPVTGAPADDVDAVVKRLGVKDRNAAGAALVREKGCARCHSGIGESTTASLPVREATGCGGPRFALDADTNAAVAAYLKLAAAEKHPSPFATRQRLLTHLRCHRCHQRDGDAPSPLEDVGRTVWSAHLYRLPYQRTPRLTQATAKLRRDYLLTTVRDGVTGVRPDWYSYRMPAFGSHAEAAVRALAEGDGDLPDIKDLAPAPTTDPTLTALGPSLVGFEGYSCVSCHVWDGKSLAAVEPGTVGPEMTSLTRRVRREWFDRFLDDPARVYPGTPMPAVFKHGASASLTAVLHGDAAKQKEALWTYLGQGKAAASPKARPPIPVPVGRGEVLVSQIPLQLPDLTVIESLCVVTDCHDAIVYDLATGSLQNVYTAASLLRQSNVWRSYQLVGTPAMRGIKEPVPSPTARTLRGYDRLADGVRVRWDWTLGGKVVAVEDVLRITKRRFVREVKGVSQSFDLPPAGVPDLPRESSLAAKPDDGHVAPLERPGYKATLYPRPKTASGEDVVMPSALATDPRDGRLFVASMKLGDLFVLRDGDKPTFDRYAGGMFQDVFGLHHDGKDLYVLHRRNLSRVREAGGTVDRVAALPHAVGNAYDWAYGLVRDRDDFLFTFAPHANQKLAGSGSLLRLKPGGATEEVAFGFRNPLGWAQGPAGEVFFTDNQGDWVATNKLCHVVPGRYYGYPNAAHPEARTKPMATTAVWVPYAWAKSINGMAYDASGGKFGPFAGQFFLAELMHGGAIVRATVEKVNGVYQGACFPFWGKGLLGPLSMTFDPKGRLYVGGVTTPGWMGQPDRGALFRLDYVGPPPFEVRSIHARPRGFRLAFTRPIDPATARAAAFQVEHYRYEYTGAYGSPEFDRTRVGVVKVEVAADGLSAEVTTAPLVRGRVYAITAAGVRSPRGEPLVHPTGVYTLNEIPRDAG